MKSKRLFFVNESIPNFEICKMLANEIHTIITIAKEKLFKEESEKKNNLRYKLSVIWPHFRIYYTTRHI